MFWLDQFFYELCWFLKNDQLERRDVAASQTLRAALSKAEMAHPGFTYDLVVGIMQRGEFSVNLNETVLRLQGAATDADSK